MSDTEKIEGALSVIYQYSGIDGAHHKDWVIDQVVRNLTGDSYDQWVKEYEGDDGEYEWETGIAP